MPLLDLTEEHKPPVTRLPDSDGQKFNVYWCISLSYVDPLLPDRGPSLYALYENGKYTLVETPKRTYRVIPSLGFDRFVDYLKDIESIVHVPDFVVMDEQFKYRNASLSFKAGSINKLADNAVNTIMYRFSNPTHFIDGVLSSFETQINTLLPLLQAVNPRCIPIIVKDGITNTSRALDEKEQERYNRLLRQFKEQFPELIIAGQGGDYRWVQFHPYDIKKACTRGLDLLL